MRTPSPSLSTASQLSLPFGKRGWFLLTIFSSAFLLFLVQPMIARMALPRVGGAPAVWNSAMLVYQASEDPVKLGRERRIPALDANTGKVIAPPGCTTPPRSYNESLNPRR